MIVIKIELHSAITGRIKNIGTLLIDNIGGSKRRGNYRVRSYRAGADPVQDREKGKLREGRVYDHPRLSNPVQNLLKKALNALGY